MIAQNRSDGNGVEPCLLIDHAEFLCRYGLALHVHEMVNRSVTDFVNEVETMPKMFLDCNHSPRLLLYIRRKTNVINKEESFIFIEWYLLFSDPANRHWQPSSHCGVHQSAIRGSDQEQRASGRSTDQVKAWWDQSTLHPCGFRYTGNKGLRNRKKRDKGINKLKRSS